jgi:CheY-like chemotaxis protein
MLDFRILVVEDEDDARRQVVELLREALPEARIDAADTVEKADAVIQDALNRGDSYDVAILDFKLPKSAGFNPEVDDTLCQKLRRLDPGMLVGHITGFPEDPKIIEHINQCHGTGTPRAPIVNKTSATWATELLDKTVEYLYRSRIERGLRQVFGSTTAAGSYERALRPSAAWAPDLSSQLVDLTADIAESWPHLDPATRRRVQEQFQVVEDAGRNLRVTLR